MVERLRDHYHILIQEFSRRCERCRGTLSFPEALQGRAYGDHALPISGARLYRSHTLSRA